MHGRLKVKTSAQQAAEKKAERALKAKAYTTAMDAILNARDNGQKDEAQMRMCAGVLHSNPDITVLWNIRKEILLHWKATSDDCDTALAKELDLSQQCLMTNPKSYGAWHHRFWCLGQMAEPDWRREIQICDKYLALDERNFHCWDYRHLISEAASRPPSEELSFTEERINVNFSNYSSWHFRSKLLPLVHPNENGSGISNEKRLAELDWATEAVFTDPEDSSVWFYHSWLLGHRDKDGQSPVPKTVLEKSLQSTRELLDLEPDSKWTRLSLILILKAIGREEDLPEIREHYGKLIEVDPMRKGYYEDMKAKVGKEM